VLYRLSNSTIFDDFEVTIKVTMRFVCNCAAVDGVNKILADIERYRTVHLRQLFVMASPSISFIATLYRKIDSVPCMYAIE